MSIENVEPFHPYSVSVALADPFSNEIPEQVNIVFGVPRFDAKLRA